MESIIQEIGARVSFYDVAFDGKYGWFCDAYTNTLCRINMDTASISIEAMIPFDRDCRPFQYGFIAKEENTLVIAPRSASAVLLYVIEDKTFHRIEIDEEIIKQIGSYNLFSGVKIYSGNAYLIPGRFPGIIKLNLSTMVITYLNGWYEPLKQKSENFDLTRVMFARCSCNVRSKLFLPCWQSNIIMLFDLETEEYSFLELPICDAVLSSMCIINDEAWVALKNSNMIIRIDMEGKEIERIVLEQIGENGIAFLAKCGHLLYVVPMYGDKMVCLDLESKKCQMVCNLVTEAISMPEELIIAQTNMLSCIKDGEERIWMYSILDGKIYRCSANGNVETYDAVLEKQEDVRRRNNHYIKMQMSENISWENEECSLEEFLEYFLEE